MKLMSIRIPVETPHGKVDLDVRVREGTSDLATATQIFAARDYDLQRLRRYPEFVSIYDSALRSGRKPLILDLGANIGMAALYFALAWPLCHVVTIEPATDNFELLVDNTQQFENITAWNAAIASTEGRACISNPDAEKWAYQTTPTSGTGVDSVPSVTVASILAEFSAQAGYEPFIIKIDIEGAETDLFSRGTEWIQRFPILIIELHDWMLCGQANSANFLRSVAPLNRDFVYIGENVFSIANPRRDANIPAQPCNDPD